jgi:hypothetical protein
VRGLHRKASNTKTRPRSQNTAPRPQHKATAEEYFEKVVGRRPATETTTQGPLHQTRPRSQNAAPSSALIRVNLTTQSIEKREQFEVCVSFWKIKQVCATRTKQEMHANVFIYTELSSRSALSRVNLTTQSIEKREKFEI